MLCIEGTILHATLVTRSRKRPSRFRRGNKLQIYPSNAHRPPARAVYVPMRSATRMTATRQDAEFPRTESGRSFCVDT
jgi:hypothetical protein